MKKSTSTGIAGILIAVFFLVCSILIDVNTGPMPSPRPFILGCLFAFITIIATIVLAVYYDVREKERKAPERERERKLSLARGFETALQYDKAAALYEELEMWEDAGRVRKLAMEYQREVQMPIKPRIPPTETPLVREREKEVITREIVKIPCKYCATLVEITATKCPNCGAELK